MAKVAILLTMIFIAGIAELVDAESKGFIFTCSRRIIKKSTENMNVDLFNVDGPGKIIISLLHRTEDTVLAQMEVDVEEGEKKLKIPFEVPNTVEYQGRLQVNGSFPAEDYDFFGEDTVDITELNSLVTLIQTDKPLYKPGQELKFRVLLMDSKLKPLGGNVQCDIWVEDPAQSRMAQWKNASLGNGIKQYEMPLSDEPVMGYWRISVTCLDMTKSANFEVKEYVLPKFEVTLKKPSFVLANAETINLELCAKYTYGKSVQGTLNMNISLESYSWSNEKFPVLEIQEQIEGCYKYILNVTHVDTDYSYVYRRIHISAEVTEDGTGVTQSATDYIDRTSTPLQLSFTEKQKPNFKPGLPYNGELKVTRPDGTPAPNEEIKICATMSRERILSKWWATRKLKYCKNFTSDANGLVKYIVPPQNTDTVRIYMDAEATKYITQNASPQMYTPKASTSMQPWFSPTGSHLQVQTNDQVLECDKTHEIDVLFTAKDNGEYKFYYKIVARGNAISEGEKLHSFDTSNAVSENEELYVDDEEVQLVPAVNDEAPTPGDDCISDSIKKEMPYIGKVTFDVEVSAVHAPSFYILIYYIKKNETVADSAKILVEKCFQNKVDMSFSDESKQPGTKTSLTITAAPNSLCGIRVVDKSIILLDSDNPLSKDRIFQELRRFDNGRTYSRNHCNDKFPRAVPQKVASSISILPPRPWSSSNYEDTMTAFETMGLLAISDFQLVTRPCRVNRPSYESYGGGIAMASVGVRGGAAGGAPPALARPAMVDASMESQPDSLKRIAESAVDVRSFFPETWLFEMQLVKDGEITTEKELPHTITEWVGDTVCINQDDGLGVSKTAQMKGFQPFFISFTLPYSVKRNETVPVIMTVFNYLQECLAVKLDLQKSDSFLLLSESSEVHLCVCGGKSATHRFIVQPRVLGNVNFTVSGSSVQDASICGDKPISDVFARDAATRPLLIEAEGYRREIVTTTMFCPNDYDNKTFKQTFEQSVPEEIVPDSGRCFISVTGNIMGSALDNLDSLVRLPTGCGEQNMVLLAPLVFIVDYMKSSGKSDSSKAINYMNTGYQRQMRYRHADGSYSAFGETDKEGSIWLTAFVCQIFGQAKRYIAIDPQKLKESIEWIVSKQQQNGAFPEYGKLLSNSLQGGLKNGQNNTAPLTAYIVISLIKSGYSNDAVINSALSYIESSEIKRSYDLALAAYAASLASSPAAEKYLEKLYAKANEIGGETWWHDVNNSKSTDIEIASYAILTHLHQGKPEDVKKASLIIRWMTHQRNAYGGFYSTQDTVVGLEALSKFSMKLQEQGPVSLNVVMEGDITERLTMTEDDKLVVHKYKANIPSTVEVTATGTGCGLIQSTTIYNTATLPKEKFFKISVTVSRTPSDSGCKHATIKVTVSYVPENKESNMAIVEIKMVSGYVPVKESLQKVMNDETIGVKRHEFASNTLVLYFDALTNEPKNIEFIVENVGQVKDTKPATAKVSDYYETEKYESTEYSIENCD